MLRSIFRDWSPAVGIFALTVACSSAGARSEVMTAPTEPVSGLGIANAGASAAARAAPSAPDPAAPSEARALGSSPMQAIEQVVTAQALLVSLLLTPFSRDRPEQPVARVDARRVDAERARASSSAR
jgi:hypothetical protein